MQSSFDRYREIDGNLLSMTVDELLLSDEILSIAKEDNKQKANVSSVDNYITLQYDYSY